jgi:hypothetical protein
MTSEQRYRLGTVRSEGRVAEFGEFGQGPGFMRAVGFDRFD